jgi:hypothetical protein
VVVGSWVGFDQEGVVLGAAVVAQDLGKVGGELWELLMEIAGHLMSNNGFVNLD